MLEADLTQQYTVSRMKLVCERDETLTLARSECIVCLQILDNDRLDVIRNWLAHHLHHFVYLRGPDIRWKWRLHGYVTRTMARRTIGFNGFAPFSGGERWRIKRIGGHTVCASVRFF